MVPTYLFKIRFKFCFFDLMTGRTKNYHFGGYPLIETAKTSIVTSLNSACLHSRYDGETEPVSFLSFGNSEPETFFYLVCRFKQHITEKEFTYLKKWIYKQVCTGWGLQFSSIPIASYDFTRNYGFPDIDEDSIYNNEIYDIKIREYEMRTKTTEVNVFVSFLKGAVNPLGIEFIRRSDTHFLNQDLR